jgi:hypothetical protein
VRRPAFLDKLAALRARPPWKRPAGPQPSWLVAELVTPDELVAAAVAFRDAGYTEWDTHSPFPVHGMERAMGMRPSRVPIFVLVLGLAGAAAGMLLQWWTSTVDYPMVVSGKPYFSWPAFVPIMFECGVLGGALGAVGGLLFETRLPRHHHPLFFAPGFERASDDRFFLSVASSDPRFDAGATERLLRELGAARVETISPEGRVTSPDARTSHERPPSPHGGTAGGAAPAPEAR